MNHINVKYCINIKLNQCFSVKSMLLKRLKILACSKSKYMILYLSIFYHYRLKYQYLKLVTINLCT